MAIVVNLAYLLNSFDRRLGMLSLYSEIRCFSRSGNDFLFNSNLVFLTSSSTVSTPPRLSARSSFTLGQG